jgi:mono/diheme cytochrome c family protein
MKQVVTGVAVAAILACVTSAPSYAGDEAQDARIQKGKVYYAKYCTPCHGEGGSPGSAVFPGTKKRIDLRTYQQRNGGRFPSSRWWDVTFNPQPGTVHTVVWERIRKDQSPTKHGESELSRELERDITARGVVANIEFYVMSIQKEND